MTTTTLNTADLIGPALDWAFAKAEGPTVQVPSELVES